MQLNPSDTYRIDLRSCFPVDDRCGALWSSIMAARVGLEHSTVIVVVAAVVAIDESVRELISTGAGAVATRRLHTCRSRRQLLLLVSLWCWKCCCCCCRSSSWPRTCCWTPIPAPSSVQFKLWNPIVIFLPRLILILPVLFYVSAQKELFLPRLIFNKNVSVPINICNWALCSNNCFQLTFGIPPEN